MPSFFQPAKLTTVAAATKTDQQTLPALAGLTLIFMAVATAGTIAHAYGLVTGLSFDGIAEFGAFLGALTVVAMVVRGLLAHAILLWNAVTVETVIATLNLNLVSTDTSGPEPINLLKPTVSGLSATDVERHLNA